MRTSPGWCSKMAKTWPKPQILKFIIRTPDHPSRKRNVSHTCCECMKDNPCICCALWKFEVGLCGQWSSSVRGDITPWFPIVIKRATKLFFPYFSIIDVPVGGK